MAVPPPIDADTDVNPKDSCNCSCPCYCCVTISKTMTKFFNLFRKKKGNDDNAEVTDTDVKTNLIAIKSMEQLP